MGKADLEDQLKRPRSASAYTIETMPTRLRPAIVSSVYCLKKLLVVLSWL